MTDRPKNQFLIVMDSLRWDVFEKTDLPFLKSFKYAKAYTHGTFTQPAHMAFMTGKLPCSFDGSQFDNIAKWKRPTGQEQHWRLTNPESKKPAKFQLDGKNIIEGFKRKGYYTIGTGGVSWFSKTTEAYLPFLDDFDAYEFYGHNSISQLQFCSKKISEISPSGTPYFFFINFAETHHPYIISSQYYKTMYQNSGGDYGHHDACMKAQGQVLEYLDNLLSRYLSLLKDVEGFVTSDHGDCLGEDGFWGHNFCHLKVLEVPIVKIEI